MITKRGNIFDNNHDLYCIGIKGCGLQPPKIRKSFPKASKWLSEAFKDTKYTEGTCLLYEDLTGALLLFFVQANRRFQETKPESVEYLADMVKRIVDNYEVNSIGMAHIVSYPGLDVELDNQIFNIINKIQSKGEVMYYV